MQIVVAINKNNWKNNFSIYTCINNGEGEISTRKFNIFMDPIENQFSIRRDN